MSHHLVGAISEGWWRKRKEAGNCHFLHFALNLLFISGLVDTKISDQLMTWKRMIFQTAVWFLGKDPKMGAQCPIWMATETVPKNEINESFYFDAHTFNWLLKMKAPEERLDEFWAHTQKLMNE